MTDAKPYRLRFPMSIIQHAVWLYYFPLSYRDVQELLHQRGIQVSHETLREWCIKFATLFAEGLRHREPRRGSRWHMDEVCTTVDGVRHWLWRAVDEHGFVLDILLQRHRDTEAAKIFLTRLLGEYDVPEVIYTDQLRSYGAAIREIPSLVNVDHQQVISTARCNNLIEQRASVASRAVLPKTIPPSYTVSRAKSAGLQTTKTRSGILSLHARIENLYHHSRTSVSAQTRRHNQKQAFQTWSMVTAWVA